MFRRIGMIIRHAKFVLKKVMPVICSAVASVGVLVTAFFSAKDAPAAKENIEKNKSNLSLTKAEAIWEKIKYGWKYFIRTGVCAVLTIFFIIMSCILSQKQITALAATLSYVTMNRDIILEKAKETLGEEKFEEFKKETDMETAKKNGFTLYPVSVEETGYGDLLCFDTYGGRMWRSSEFMVSKGISKYLESFEDGNDISINGFYNNQGINESLFGEQWGYINHPDYYDATPIITYEIIAGYVMKIGGKYVSLNEDVCVITFHTLPMEYWDRQKYFD